MRNAEKGAPKVDPIHTILLLLAQGRKPTTEWFYGLDERCRPLVVGTIYKAGHGRKRIPVESFVASAGPRLTKLARGFHTACERKRPKGFRADVWQALRGFASGLAETARLAERQVGSRAAA